MKRKPTFLEKLFGGKLARELHSCERSRNSLAENYQVLLKKYNNLNLDFVELTNERNDLKKQFSVANKANIEFVEQLIADHNAELADLAVEKLKLLEQIKILSEAMPAQLTIPNADDYILTEPLLYEPFKVGIPISVGLIADAEYMVPVKEEYHALLAACWTKTKKIVGKYRKNVADCDDFAVVMSAIVVGAFTKSKFDMQGAFFFVRSRTHAFNVFVVERSGVWDYHIFEPQNGLIVGKLGDRDLDPMYQITEMWLLGSELPPS